MLRHEHRPSYAVSPAVGTVLIAHVAPRQSGNLVPSIQHMAFIDQSITYSHTPWTAHRRRCTIGPGGVMPQDIEGIGLLVSRSVTKDLQLPDRIMGNLGIMRLRSVWMTTI